MTQEEQTAAFADELGRLIERYISEFNLTAASVMGTLELAKLDVYQIYLEEDQKP